MPAHEFRVEVRVFNWGLLGELWYIISTTNIWVSVLGYVKNNIIQIFFLYEGNTIALSCFTFYCLVWFFNWNKVHLQSKLYVSCGILSVVILNFNLRIILFFFDNFRAFTLLHRLQITISNMLYRCRTLKYFFYHQIFFQDSAQTEKLTVFSNPKYTAWTFWNTEHEIKL